MLWRDFRRPPGGCQRPPCWRLCRGLTLAPRRPGREMPGRWVPFVSPLNEDRCNYETKAGRSQLRSRPSARQMRRRPGNPIEVGCDYGRNRRKSQREVPSLAGSSDVLLVTFKSSSVVLKSEVRARHPQDEPAMATSLPSARVRCPNCYSSDVRLSHQTRLDWILGVLFRWKAFRCRNCRHRFHRRIAVGSGSAQGFGG